MLSGSRPPKLLSCGRHDTHVGSHVIQRTQRQMYKGTANYLQQQLLNVT